MYQNKALKNIEGCSWKLSQIYHFLPSRELKIRKFLRTSHYKIMEFRQIPRKIAEIYENKVLKI